MRRATWLIIVGLAGCGGQELLIDGTPPTLIPNGGSAQAGQVDGPTAIPITGEGAIFAAPAEAEPSAVVAEPAPIRSVEDEAAIEAIGMLAEAAAADGVSEHRELADAGSDVPAPPPVAPIEESASSAASASPLRTRTVSGPRHDLDIPAAWEDLDPTGLGSMLIMSANRSMEAVDGFLPNVLVSAEPFEGDAQSYALLNVPSLLEAGCALRDSQPSRAGRRAAVDVEAYWLNITGVPYVTLQRYTTTGEAGYVITCAAAATAFESERETCLDILDSFRVD